MNRSDVSFIRRLLIDAFCRIGGFFFLCYLILHVVAYRYPAFLIAHHHPNIVSLLLIYVLYFLGFRLIKRWTTSLHQSKSESKSWKP